MALERTCAGEVNNKKRSGNGALDIRKMSAKSERLILLVNKKFVILAHYVVSHGTFS